MDLDVAKADLHRYLQTGRDVMLWKAEGLSEYDVRRPLVPTGTSLLGTIKHLAFVEAGYFGVTFDRPMADLPDWMAEPDDPNADLWVTADERREDVISLYRRVWAHADATITELDLDARGRVPWWGEHGDVTLHRVLIHVATETHRHAGQADILRELIDGVVGYDAPGDNLPEEDTAWWAAHRDRVEQAARQAAQHAG